MLIPGIAHLLADGLSMGVSNCLAIRSEERVHEANGGTVPAGAVPLLPSLFPRPAVGRFITSSVLSLAVLFVVGAI